MTVVYFLQSHKNLAQIRRLVHRIKDESPDAYVLITHHTASFRIEPAVFAGLSDVYVTHVDVAERAEFSLVSPFLDAVDWLIERGVAFDWIVTLSGQCYPARSLVTFEHMLEQSEVDGYMRHFDAFTRSQDNPWGPREARHRYLYHYALLRRGDLPNLTRKLLSIPRRVLNTVQPFIQLNTSYGLRLGSRAWPSIFHANFRCYGGSWFKTLSYKSAAYLSQFTREHPEMIGYFRRTLIPDETYIQTVIANNPALRLYNDNLHYFDWRNGRLGHPRTLTSAEYGDIINSGAFFARKFDIAQDERILDMLDERALAEQSPISYGV